MNVSRTFIQVHITGEEAEIQNAHVSSFEMRKQIKSSLQTLSLGFFQRQVCWHPLALSNTHSPDPRKLVLIPLLALTTLTQGLTVKCRALYHSSCLPTTLDPSCHCSHYGGMEVY
jgi:hypothetical protein